MSSNLVVLVIALVLVSGLIALLWRGQGGPTASTVKLSLSNIFTMDLSLSPANTAKAEEAALEATKVKGQGAVRPDLTSIGSTTALARVLWVDDIPENNIFETLALERLGKLVTVATSTEMARIYLSRLEFAVVITDLHRDGDPRAGADFIHETRAAGNDIPLLVYTSNAETAQADEQLVAEADAVVDAPEDLLKAVEAHVVKRHIE
ncbi:response regulator [Amycolatopsis vancoresmycina]|uniref:Transcriptional regulator CadC n=1 Tax=Amycolatopsis vancoresmycina DSM 44592 TaxID=1292037 RepID=R1GDF5_9PSEU|nr:response regulator [Amycolatopsis vancoresmycina]EOD69298.1 transcriptional regulator CadC [Amycolatopsis vancoresmycina DSM 44592]